MLCIGSSELVNLQVCALWPICPHFLLLLAPGTHHSTLVLWVSLLGLYLWYLLFLIHLFQLVTWLHFWAHNFKLLPEWVLSPFERGNECVLAPLLLEAASYSFYVRGPLSSLVHDINLLSLIHICSMASYVVHFYAGSIWTTYVFSLWS